MRESGGSLPSETGNNPARQGISMPDVPSMLELAGNRMIQRMEIEFKGIKNISNDLNIYEL